MINYIKILSYIIISLYFSPVGADNFIFDLDGVLVRTGSLSALKHAGLNNIIQTMISLKKDSMGIQQYIEKKFLEVLAKASQEHGFDINNIENPAYYRHEEVLPYLMQAWLRGLIKSKKVRDLVVGSIDANPQWFSTKSEKRLIKNLIKMVFTPENFVESRRLNKRALDFVKARKEEGHKLYILSNWDPESFALLQKKHNSVFAMFDGVLISGEINMAKPSPDIYEVLLKTHKIAPAQSWFIDDQRENIAAACSLDIKGVLCEPRRGSKKPNFYLVGQKIPQCPAPKENWVPRAVQRRF